MLHCSREVKQVRFQLGGSCWLPGGENMNLLFSSFQGSNEEKWVVTGRGSIVKCRETSLEGEGFFKKRRRTHPRMTVIKMERKPNKNEVGMEWESIRQIRCTM